VSGSNHWRSAADSASTSDNEQHHTNWRSSSHQLRPEVLLRQALAPLRVQQPPGTRLRAVHLASIKERDRYHLPNHHLPSHSHRRVAAGLCLRYVPGDRHALSAAITPCRGPRRIARHELGCCSAGCFSSRSLRSSRLRAADGHAANRARYRQVWLFACAGDVHTGRPARADAPPHRAHCHPDEGWEAACATGEARTVCGAILEETT
jgi:hypothetical protein